MVLAQPIHSDIKQALDFSDQFKHAVELVIG